jgi:hypothetical protein
MAGGPAPKWPVHGSTVDFHRGRRQGSPELGLAAAPGHGGSPRGWRRDGHVAARPGGYSPEPGRRRGGGALATEVRPRSELDAGAEESKRKRESERRRCGSGRGSSGAFIGAGGGTGEG